LFGGDNSYAYACSADGSAVTGYGSYVGDESLGDRAFRWTAQTGMQNLGFPPGSLHTYGNIISGDGLVVAGYASYSSGPHHACLSPPPCLCRPQPALVDPTPWPPTLGVNPTGWVLTEAYGLSADGSAVSGTGTYNGQQRAFLVRGLFGTATCYANCDGSTAA